MIKFIDAKNPKKKLFHFWFHTWFIEPQNANGTGLLYLNKNMIDNASGDKSGRYDPNFSIKLFMTKVDNVSYEWKGQTGIPTRVIMPNQKKQDVYNLVDLQRKGFQESDEEEEEQLDKTKPKERLKIGE